jgi:hypothetical protein
VSAKQKQLQEDLESLPESFEDNPQIKFMTLCGEFISKIDEHTAAKSGSETDFFQLLLKKFEKLKCRIHSTRPVFEIEKRGDESDSDVTSVIGRLSPATDHSDEAMSPTRKPGSNVTNRRCCQYRLCQDSSSTKVRSGTAGCHSIQCLRDIH